MTTTATTVGVARISVHRIWLGEVSPWSEVRVDHSCPVCLWSEFNIMAATDRISMVAHHPKLLKTWSGWDRFPQGPELTIGKVQDR